MNSGTPRLIGRKACADFILYIVVSIITSYLFYDSLYAIVIFIFLLPFYTKRLLLKYNDELKRELCGQFCEMIGSLSASLSNGISTENAFIVARNDMERLYTEDSIIVKELGKMIDEFRMNVPVTVALVNFANRSSVSDIKDFATVFNEAVITGGNLASIIKDTAFIMQDKRRTEDEISAMLKGKMLEQKVICIIPFLILSYLRFTSKEFINILYHNIAGIIIMSICLVIYIVSVILSEKIIKIKV